MRLARFRYAHGVLLAGLLTLLLTVFPHTTSGQAERPATNVSKITTAQYTELFQKCTGSQTSRDSKSTDAQKIYSEMFLSAPCNVTVADYTLQCAKTSIIGAELAWQNSCTLTAKSDNSTLSSTDTSSFFGTGAGANTQNEDGDVTGKGLNGSCSGDLKDSPGCQTLTTAPTVAACTLGPGGNLKDCLTSIMGYIIAAIGHVMLMVVAAILGFANYLLGWTIYITVFQFGNLMGNSEGLLAAWRIVRDVGNILLLFGFIFMGVSTILNLPNSEFTAKRALPALIIFALLMNFSLLVTEGIIDVSNAFATSIHDQISGGDVCTGETGVFDCAINKGIGGRLMAMSGVSGIWDFKNIAGSGDGIRTAIIYVGLIVFVVITTLVLMAAAVMLLIRALILAFLMVTSPIGFAGMAIPPLQEVAKKWWDELICQATFAPVYFLLVLVSFKLMEGVMKALGTSSGVGIPDSQNLAAIFGGSETAGQISNISIGITFALIIGFMIASLMFAKKSSCIGSGMAIKAGGSFAFGSLGWVGRATGGRVMYHGERVLKNTDFGTKNRVGMAMVGLLGKGGRATFDARTISPVKDHLTSAAGPLGTPNKGGYADKVHKREETRKKYAEGIGNTDTETEEIVELRAENYAAGKEVEKAKQKLDVESARLDSEIADEKAKNQEALKALDKQRDEVGAKNTELEGARKEAEELRKKAEEMRQQGYIGQADALDAKVQTAEERVRGLENAYNADKAALEQAEAKVNERVNQLQAAKSRKNEEYKNLKIKTDDETKQRKRRISDIEDLGKQRKRDYAETIHHPSVWGQTVGRIIGPGNATGDHHAAVAILKDTYKSKDKKLTDAVKEYIKGEETDGDDKEEHGGGGRGGGAAPATGHGAQH